MRHDAPLIRCTGITHIDWQAPVLHLHTPESVWQITVYDEAIIQVRAIQQGQAFEDFSYAVTALPQPCKATFEETATYLHLSTSLIRVEISKHALRIAFYDVATGILLNADDEGLGVVWYGTEVSNYKQIHPKERFVGMGEKNGSIDRRGRSYTHWNHDNFAYGSDSDPLYVSTPFYIGLHQQQAYGIFLDNTYRSKFNFGASNDRFMYFRAEAGELRYYFIHEAQVADIVRCYTHLTGRIELPPLWSLGYQQCRYSYYPEHEIQTLAETFRRKQIPCDVLYLDIHYMEKYKIFTWDNTRFPDPAALIAQLKEQGFEVVLIFDPGIKVEAGYEVYEQGKAQGVFVQYPDGELYRGQVWPGWCHFPDFTNPTTRQWWGEYYKSLVEVGVGGYWNDMNEPAVWGNDFPDVVEFNYDGQTATHRKAHNVYGLQMIRATYEGLRRHMGNRRPFTLTRSGFSGVQRYAAVWSGDNVSEVESMLSGIRLLASMGLAGMSYCGADVGGFVGECSVELFQKWIAVAAFTPFYRAHTMINARDVEPWSFGEETEEIARNYISLRYRLLPYLYAAFYEASQTGMPIMRSLVLEDAFDDKIYEGNYQNQFLCGGNILVCAIAPQQTIHKVYLPAGEWYELYRDIRYAGGQELYYETNNEYIPVFVRAGGMLMMQSAIQHTAQASARLELHVYHGDMGSEYLHYEDDGSSYDYTQGVYYRRLIRFAPYAKQLTLEAAEGNYTPKHTTCRVYWHGFPADFSPATAGALLPIATEDYQHLKPISSFDPWGGGEDDSKTLRGLRYSDIAWGEAFIQIAW